MRKILIASGIVIAILFLAVPFNIFHKKMPVNNDDVIKALEAKGYTNIEIINAECVVVSQHYDVSSSTKYTVKATNSVGDDVEFYVYCGLLFNNIAIKTK